MQGCRKQKPIQVRLGVRTLFFFLQHTRARQKITGMNRSMGATLTRALLILHECGHHLCPLPSMVPPPSRVSLLTLRNTIQSLLSLSLQSALFGDATSVPFTVTVTVDLHGPRRVTTFSR